MTKNKKISEPIEEGYEVILDEIDAAIMKIKEYAFMAFSKFDFVDLADMLNYRSAVFSKVDSPNSLEEKYIYNTPGNYEPLEIQIYIYHIVMEAIDRFRSEYEYSQQNGIGDEDILGEYFNHGTGILCRVKKDFVEISYIPIESNGTED